MDYERARRFFFWVGVGAGIGILIVVGCQEADRIIADRIIADVNSVASSGQMILESPAGQLVPPDVRLYAALGLNLIMAGAAAYEKWRLHQMTKTAKAIVQGIETAEKQQQGDSNPENPTKTAIATEMRKAHIYDAGNRLVDRLKLS